MILLLTACRPDPVPPPISPELSVDDAALDGLVLARSFAVEVRPEAPVDAVCTSPTEPDERHVLHSAAAGHHDLRLFGLLADTPYDCRFTSGDQEVRTVFDTDPLPDGFPTWSLTVPSESDGDDYILFNEGLQPSADDPDPRLFVVDRQGHLRWYYQSPSVASDLDANYRDDGTVLFGGGYDVAPTRIDLAGAVLAEAGPSSTGHPYNHEARPLATGEVATFAVDWIVDGIHDTWEGFAIDVLDDSLGSRTWTWNSQQGFDEGWLPYLSNPDPYHANAMTIEGDDVYVDLRSLGRMVKLSRATGEREWSLGPGQDFALVDAAGNPADPVDWFYMPHDPEKDGDDFLMYDNGVNRPGGSFSRAVLFHVDQAARTATVRWQYTEPGWYEPIWGDADRLPNGHVLIVRGHCEDCRPDTGQRTELVEVDPADDRVVWRLTYDDPQIGGYRAQRIDGCSIFSNERYCVTAGASDR